VFDEQQKATLTRVVESFVSQVRALRGELHEVRAEVDLVERIMTGQMESDRAAGRGVQRKGCRGRATVELSEELRQILNRRGL
jgi:hypothetical protein